MTVATGLAKTAATVLTISMGSDVSANLLSRVPSASKRWIPAPPAPVPTAPSAAHTSTTRISPAPVPSASQGAIVMKILMSVPSPHLAATEPLVSTPLAAIPANARKVFKAGTA